MKLLILGASDSEGTLLAHFSDSWREILRVELPSLLGKQVEIDHRRYYVHLPGTHEYLERCLAETKPDLVILGATGFAFSAQSVGNRLRRLLGTRAGNWFERRFESFDSATDGPEHSIRDRVNSAGHWMARSAIGQEGLSSFDEVLAAYSRTLERLARIEDLDVIVMGTTYNGPAIQRRVPGIQALVDRFNEELRRVATTRHFAWIDRQALISALPRDTDRPDQLHAGPEIHRAYAEALKPTIVALAR